MSVLSRVSLTGQQRFDLSTVVGSESFTAYDFRALSSSFVGSDSAYILRGLSVVGRSGLSVSISTKDCFAYNPQDNNGSFYYGLATDPDEIVQLPSGQTNIYVEATFSNATQNPINIGVWDPLALTGANAAGTEFTTTADFEEYIKLSITVNTVGFTAGAIPLLTASTSGSSITAMEDARELFFRLGTGGTTPNSLHKFPWSNARSEPSPSGVAVGENAGSPWQSQDATGIINDKGIHTFKQWMDAVMTRISEITGSALWYQSGISVGPASNVSLNQVFFDTLGHSIQPSQTSTFKWKESGGGYVLAGEGQVSGISPFAEGLVSWKGIYSDIEWQLGDVFQSSTSRLYNSVRFTSPLVPDGSSLFLLLEREAPKGSGSNVAWGSNASYPTYPANQSISGVTGDFTGIAIGDYVRKQSEGYTRYYKVSQFYNGVVSISTPGQIADSSAVALLLSAVISVASTEPLAFFRSRYSSADLYVGAPGAVTDANYYWLGTNRNNLFYLRGFGTLQDGEEIRIIDDTYSHGNTGGASGLLLEHAPNAVYNGSGYSLSTGSGTLLTMYRYARDNTVERPTPGSDNSGAMLSYTITAPVGLLTPGDSLWVRLSDTTGGVLSNGPVTNSTDNLNNTDTSTNKWEVRPASTTPPKTLDDKDIFWVAKYVLQGSTPTLIFNDGSALDDFGLYANGSLSIADELRIASTAVKSVLFIDPVAPGVVTSDVSNFSYDKSSPKLTITNFEITNNNIAQTVPSNATLLSNLGGNTLTIGQATSTTYIPGGLVVEGPYSALNVQQLQVVDKLVSLGIGDLADGGFGGGMEVADDTRTAVSQSTVIATNLVTLTFGASIAGGYATGDIIGVNADSGVGGITAGQIGGQYTIQAGTPVAPNEAQLTSPTTLVLYANSAATSTASSSTLPPKIFRGRWSVRVSDSSGSTAGTTSWAFTSKQTTTAPALTPVTSYGTVPTANSSNMVATRVPFVNADGQGPSGADTTLNFASVFTYNSGTGVLTVPSVATSYNDWFQQGSFLAAPGVGYSRLFAKDDHQIYYRTSDGNISSMSEKNLNVYDENVDVVAVPSGNNQTAPIPTPPVTITLPLDTRRHVGSGLTATTTATSATVVVSKYAHGLTSGQLVTVTTGTAIGGISPANLSQIGVVLTVVNADSFSYVAGAVASSSTTGSLDLVEATTVRSYLVGDRTLAVYLNDILQRPGVDYTEVGALSNPSTSISFLRTTVVGDTLRFRIDNNGGMVVYSSAGGGGSTLQSAYNAGATITTTFGNPVSVSGTSGDTLATFNGNISVSGLIL